MLVPAPGGPKSNDELFRLMNHIYLGVIIWFVYVQMEINNDGGDATCWWNLQRENRPTRQINKACGKETEHLVVKRASLTRTLICNLRGTATVKETRSRRGAVGAAGSCGPADVPIATARSRITSGRKPGGPLSLDRGGIVGVRHGRTAELFWLDQKRRSARQRVLSVWLKVQRTTHPIR